MSSLFGIGGGGNVGAAGGFYPYSIENALRFNDDDNAYLNITYGGSHTSTALGTVSFWMKRGTLGSSNIYFEGSGYGGIQLRSDKLAVNSFDSSNTQVIVQTDAVLRDVSSWYHCVVSINGTAGTIKFYINGVEQAQTVTNGSLVAGRSWDMLGYDSRTSFKISNTGSNQFDGYLAEFHYIDGTALDATSFGETSNGVWVPKNVSGLTYGTNGFYLSFADSAAIGDDLSGNTNDFTANSLATSDVVPDSPTNNFATINNIYRGSNTNTAAYGLTSEGNLKFSYSSNSDAGTLCTHPFASGKYYWELRIVAGGGSSAYQHGTGIANIGAGYRKITNLMDGRDPNEIGMQSYTGQIRQGSTTVVNTLSTTNMPNGAIIGCAVDADNGAIYWSYNGTFMNSSDPTSGASKTNAHATWTPADEDMWVPTIAAGGGSVPVNVINFGQDSTFAGNETAGGNSDANGYGDFAYAPPSGFLALCSANLPEPTISPNAAEQADGYFSTVLWSGDGTNPGDAQEINGLSFQPDFVWVKGRSGTQWHELHDSVRGVGNRVFSNETNAETDVQSMTSFDNDGFTVAIGTAGNNGTNENGSTYVGWSWKAGGTAVSNTDGSITSSVSAAPDAGFSICTWTGNGTSGATIGHGLSSAPELIFSKRRDSSGMWTTYAKPAASDAETDYLRLDGTDALADDSRIWNDTVPTASVFSVGSGTSHINTNSATHVTYCFHSVDGFSKVGSYVGNGSADGPMVVTNFRPAFLLVKGAGNTYGWYIHDSTRDTFNHTDAELAANSSGAEYSAEGAGGGERSDFLSNGFKVRTSNVGWNQSGITYIYLAFAEAPFKYANAR